MTRFTIDGRILTQQVTGTQRYGRELLRELDGIVAPGQLELLVPEAARGMSVSYNSIEIKYAGTLTGPAWTHIDFAAHCRREHTVPVGLSNIAPATLRSIVVLHDVSPTANPTYYGWRFRAMMKATSTLNTRMALAVITDTQFSGTEIARYYPAARNKTYVIPCGWQHIHGISADYTVFERHSALADGSYYFAMSSLAPNKNLRWVVETARLNPNVTIAVAGSANPKVFGRASIPEADNVIYLGYVTDGEAKALMERTIGFLFPTFYEGFGLPPMEALACGAPVAVSDRSCMREVYGSAARYLDPDTPCSNLEGLFTASVADPGSVLEKFSWRKCAQSFLEVLHRV